MATPLMRSSLRGLYESAKRDPHPGLLLQRGLAEHREDDAEARTKHAARVCQSTAGDFYRRAYARWRQATADVRRFRSVILKIESRLFIGLAGSGMLETGSVISHSYGTPCIPGSSIKGVVNAHARERLPTADGEDICNELFGAPATEGRPAGQSGLISVHDAWWVPDSAEHPWVREVVTSHHQDYYGRDGSTPATDFDSPVPNAQIAVHGKFLFVLEGPAAWLELAEQMLVAALSTRGAGAKTRAGYGLFSAETARGFEAERRRREQEAAEREHEAKQATMTAEQRALDDLRRRLDEARREKASSHGQGGPLATAARKVLKDAQEWPDETNRIQAADLAEEVFQTIGFPKSRKGIERRRQIEDLRKRAR